jgi:predicted tellurium resistance membrane protein TerC
MVKLTAPLFAIFDFGVSGRDLILLGGGLFLIVKSTWEIWGKLRGSEGSFPTEDRAKFGTIIVQIVLLDVVFSLDSVITAVGMANELGVMIAAVIIALLVMLRYADAVNGFVQEYPTLNMLALAFLWLIGVTLIAEGMHGHINKGYIYFAMAFSFGVELLNLRLHTKSKPAETH